MRATDYTTHVPPFLVGELFIIQIFHQGPFLVFARVIVTLGNRVTMIFQFLPLSAEKAIFSTLGFLCISGGAANIAIIWVMAKLVQHRSRHGSLFKVLHQTINFVNVLVCFNVLVIVVVNNLMTYSTEKANKLVTYQGWACKFWIITWNVLQKGTIALIAIVTACRTVSLARPLMKMRMIHVSTICLVLFIAFISESILILSVGNTKLFFDEEDMLASCISLEDIRGYSKLWIILSSWNISLFAVSIGAMFISLFYLIFLLSSRHQQLRNQLMERRVIVVEAVSITVNTAFIIPILIFRVEEIYQAIDIFAAQEIEHLTFENAHQSVLATEYHLFALIEVFCLVIRCNLDPMIQLVRMKFFKDMVCSRINYLRDKALKLVLKTLLTFHDN